MVSLRNLPSFFLLLGLDVIPDLVRNPSSVLCANRQHACAAVLAALIAGLAPLDADAQDRYEAQRQQMIEDIARTTRETRIETGRGELSDRVMNALRRVPRHRLIPPSQSADAYRNRPLSIGQGQTISQPFIVALMTDLLDVKPGDKVLEIGTGSGYQAAVLAELSARVYTIEILEPLGRDAAARLRELGYTSIVTRIGDGNSGWPEEAPFDSIIVTAAAREVPQALQDQLKPGGKLVIPLGDSGAVQNLVYIEKELNGALTRRQILAVRFVPLTGRERTPR